MRQGRRKGQKEQQIFIKTKNQGYTLNLSSILYIENRGKKVDIHTTDMEEIIETYATMDELDKADRENHGIGLANIKSTLKSIREQWILR